MLSIRNDILKKGLNDFCKYINKFYNTKELTIVEIGSFAGESTVIFAKYFKKVISIDPYEEKLLDEDMKIFSISKAEQDFIERTKNLKNVIKLKMKSLDFANSNSGKYDIIYIDAKHDYDSVKADIINFLPLCKKFISGHDFFAPGYPGVVNAVNEILGKPDKVFQDNSWLVRLKNG